MATERATCAIRSASPGETPADGGSAGGGSAPICSRRKGTAPTNRPKPSTATAIASPWRGRVHLVGALRRAGGRSGFGTHRWPSNHSRPSGETARLHFEPSHP